MLFRSLLIIAALLPLAAGSVSAQPWGMFEGSWTIGDGSRCAAQRYEIADQGEALLFRDQDGKVNVETIVQRRSGGLSTQTIISGQVPAYTRWDYQQTGANTIEVRNLTLGRAFALARCPGFSAAVQVTTDDGAAASLSFAQRYYATWSSDNQTALAFAAAHYLPDVSFYGKSTPRGTIMQQKENFVRRWPVRSYAIVPGSVSTRCGGGECEITGTVDWTCRSPERNAESAGVATFTLRLVGQGPATMIALETGAVTGRRTPGQDGSSAPAATWSPPPPSDRPAPPAPPAPPAAAQIEVPPSRP